MHLVSSGAAPADVRHGTEVYSRYTKYLTDTWARVTLGKPRPRGVFMAVHYESFTDGRKNLSALIDAARQGRVATLRRDNSRTAFVDVERLRHFLASVHPAEAQVVSEGSGWSVFIPGLPVAADAATFDEAITEMIVALREYAEDWQDRLQHAPNHRENWGLVQLIGLSDDAQLAEWLVGARR
jgi:hypothetical protein